MASRAPQGQPRARGGRGRAGRGGPPGAAGRGGGSPLPAAPGGEGITSAHVSTIGVKRTGYGTSGRAINVITNHYKVDIPQGMIYHYDAILPSELKLPARLNVEIIRHLQEIDEPQVFTPRAVYDGKKNMFSIHEFPFPNGSQQFDVSLADPSIPRDREGGKGPRIYKVRLTKVAEINPEVLSRFLEGKQSHENMVLTAITALNVVIRMAPTMKYPFNVRSFFTDRETQDIGSGIVLWRGFFQSVRPASGRMLINVDISTGAMYKPGRLIDLCLDFLGRQGGDPLLLAPARGFPERERLRLQHFVSGVRVVTSTPAQRSGRPRAPRPVKGFSRAGANQMRFDFHGQQITVAQYFQQNYNFALRYPDLLCVEVGRGELIPLEMCTVPPGQIMRKQIPPEKTKDVLNFATKKPHERLASIKNALGVLAYGESEYVRNFGLKLHQDHDRADPISVPARVLNPPTLKYGEGSKELTVVPRDGAWNMIHKRFYRPSTIERWVVVVFERRQRFNDATAREMIAGLVEACRATGIIVKDDNPIVRWENAQGNIAEHLRAAGKACNEKTKGFPNLIVAVLPEGGADIYTAVKHFGDVAAGVATQCLKSLKCFKAKQQYYANVCLKINVKLGGINTIPDPRSVSILTDPRNPTVVMGADVMHPPPGADGRPSFTALVGNVDSDTAKYVADCRVQTSGQEMIEDLQSMAEHILKMYMNYRQNVEKKTNIKPRRILFYRDGVSEGQFKQVLEIELPCIKQACENLGIEASITVIVVGKRHHVRFFPKTSAEGDKTGNCRAGTVIDRDITHPTEQDFFLLSHAGLIGTSRPAHYNVLYDDNQLSADAVQALSFALCHVYARCTRSVSIPAPVYYADIVCSRAKNHYDPQTNMQLTDTVTHDSASAKKRLEEFQSNFKRLHQAMSYVMYFS